MEVFYFKIIESAIVIILYLAIKRITSKLINRTLLKNLIHESRGRIIKSIINLIISAISLIFLLLIWGVKQTDLAVFMGSVLTVIGVAFFAQWSLLSNITSSIIIFFNHPVKLNDTINILEGKDYSIEGKVTQIGLFFITLETKDLEKITLPNNIFILKSIKNITKESREDSGKSELQEI